MTATLGETLHFLIPACEFRYSSREDWTLAQAYATLEWKSPGQPPTLAEIEAARPAASAALTAPVTNEATLRQQAEAALASNKADIATAESWLAANTGNALTSAVLTTAVKFLVRGYIASLRQRNGLIRKWLGRFEAVD